MSYRLLSLSKIIFSTLMFVNSTTNAFAVDQNVIVNFKNADGSACQNINEDSLNIVYDNLGTPAISFYLPDLSLKLPAVNADGTPATRIQRDCFITLNFKILNGLAISDMNANLELKGTVGITTGVIASAEADVSFLTSGDRFSYREYLGSARWIGPKTEPFYLKNSHNIDLDTTGLEYSNDFDVKIKVIATMELDEQSDPQRSAGILRLKTGDLRPKIEFKIKLTEQ